MIKIQPTNSYTSHSPIISEVYMSVESRQVFLLKCLISIIHFFVTTSSLYFNGDKFYHDKQVNISHYLSNVFVAIYLIRIFVRVVAVLE